MIIIKKIICIYNANGTLKGELKYIYNKLFKNIKCSMCEITHNTFMFKKKWDERCSGFNYKIECLHLDELPKDIKELVTDNAPCVVAQTNSSNIILLKNNELVKIDGSVDLFFNALEMKIQIYSE
tara:strand:+ start:66 stop:440 length:375 start_codon:yes stop_codon:yes gene_type:complete